MKETTWQEWHARRVGEANNRVIAVEQDGRRLWIKRAQNKAARWHRWQDRFARLTGLKSLRCTMENDGRAALRKEALVLARLKLAGTHVPDVVAMGDDWIALSDLGPPLRDQLNKAATPADATTLALAGVQALGRLHAAGLCHGNAQARNLAGPPDRLGFIDFEEDVLERIELTSAQVRDWVLFLMSLEKTDSRHGVVMSAAVGCAQAVMPPLARRQLRWVRRVAWPLGTLLNPLRRWLGRDAREAVAFACSLRELQNPAEQRRKRLLQSVGALLGMLWLWLRLVDAD